MIERDELARRLEPVLSETPESARDLMTRAGLEVSRRIAGVVTVALLQLKRAGLARSHGTQPNIKWTRVTADQGVERLPLARLDATLIFTTTARTTVGGTRRTELAATVELGPSWPEGTRPPPRWSTAFSDAQLASGAMTGARSNALRRAEAHLRSLRADKTLSPLPTEEPVTHRPNPLLLPSKNREAFFSYLASVQPDGARRDSACTRLATLGLATTTAEAEAWLDELVEQGLLAERTKRAGDGTVVVRYLPAIPTTPAPLPKSSAPAEEAPAPAVVEPKITPKAKPARETRIGKDTYRGAPPKARPAPVDEDDTGDPPDDDGALDDPAEHDSEDPPQVEESGEVARLTRERDDARRQAVEADRKWQDKWNRAWNESAHFHEALCTIVPGLRGAAPEQLTAGARERVRELEQEIRFAQAFVSELHAALGLSSLLHRRELLARVVALVEEARAAAARPGLDGAALRHYLLSLPEPLWQQLGSARVQLASARALARRAQEAEQAALAAVDSLLEAPAGASAPAPELVPDPIELGPALPATPEPPASGEQANDDGEGGSMLDRVRRFFEAHPTETINAPMLAERLGCLAKHVSPSLSILFREGFLEKPRLGFYRLARKGRRAA